MLHLDDLSRQVSLFLAQRAETLLQSKAAPELSLKQNPSKKFEKGRRQLNQHRPGEDGGLNKLERLKLLVQDRSKGHDWYWNQAKNPGRSAGVATELIGLEVLISKPSLKNRALRAVSLRPAKLLPQDPKQAGVRNLFSQPAPSASLSACS